MTKQEIEEMAQAMCGYCNDGKCIFRNCAPCDKFNSQECSYKEDAEELYYAGYRKVLLDTEDGKLVDCVQYAPWQLIEGYTEREIEKVRKETAREILSRIKLYATDSKTDLIDLINEIANANGVEVEDGQSKS